MEVSITTSWDSSTVDHAPISVGLHPDIDGCRLCIRAPLFNDPPSPGGEAGKSFPQLWDYEVVEAFFLNQNEEYLEVELCPHGQHLVLLLKGKRNIVQEQLDLEYSASIDGDWWRGEALIPYSYFPPQVTKFNAFAIHGSGISRVYEALYPTRKGEFTKPDFHRLEYFQPIEMKTLLPSNWTNYTSDIWDQYTDQQTNG